MQLSCLIVLACIGLSGATVSIEYQKPQPGKAPFCVDKIEGKKKVGEDWPDLNQCGMKRCLTDSQGTPLISHNSCGTIEVPKNCELVTPSESKRYPECCPQLQCPEDKVE